MFALQLFPVINHLHLVGLMLRRLLSDTPLFGTQLFEINDYLSLCLMVSPLVWRQSKCVRCFTPCMEMLFGQMTTCPEQGAEDSCVTQNEQPLFSTHKGIRHQARP